VIDATSEATCEATGSGSGRQENSNDSAQPAISASVEAAMIATRVFSASGPNTRVAGTTRSLSCEIGASQNGRKPPARNRTPIAFPSPDSRRANNDVSTPYRPAPDASKTRFTFGWGRIVCSCGGCPRRSQRTIQ
jgi:hypothetical protein